MFSYAMSDTSLFYSKKWKRSVKGKVENSGESFGALPTFGKRAIAIEKGAFWSSREGESFLLSFLFFRYFENQWNSATNMRSGNWTLHMYYSCKPKLQGYVSLYSSREPALRKLIFPWAFIELFEVCESLLQCMSKVCNVCEQNFVFLIYV